MIYSRRLIFKVYEQLISISPEDITCCMADEDWTIICLTGNREVQINKPITEVMEKLPELHFSRIHQCWIVNVHYIDEVFWDDNYLKMIDGLEIPFYHMMKFRLENILLDNPVFCGEVEFME